MMNWKEVVTACFKVFYRHLLGETKENCGNLQNGWSGCQNLELVPQNMKHPYFQWNPKPILIPLKNGLYINV
jgi:hypothetical protein